MTGEIDWRTKGFWNPGPPVPDEEFAAARHNLFGGAFTWPVLIARRDAIDANVRTMADFAERHGLSLAPHGKTTMAPALFTAQLAAGAWAITAATANQVLAYRAWGVPRVLLANEVLDPVVLRWFAAEVAAGFDLLCYADSVAGVAALADAMATVPGSRPLRVLAEWGYAGGRTGCRTVEQLTAVAQAVAAAPGLQLAGVAGFEGSLPDLAAADEFAASLRAAAEQIAHHFEGEEAILSAGGSAFFDVVLQRLTGDRIGGRPLRTVLRSGAYISHDHEHYAQTTPFGRLAGEGSLTAALEIWAQVTSTPEPGLALVGMGKREAPYDLGLPVPLRVRRPSGAVEAATGLSVLRLNDHHAYVSVAGPLELAPGDLVGFGISHPCTAFDRWSAIPLVAADDTVTGVIRTYF
ncbi:alanine racemase [Hamadaea tsunoensis]|uniref:alanine racemase n=1 Tax=Hamadaea tsunoensis TaxID=53368 RepID=UPI0003F8F951|nr:alanine racemase [Hamadaea tsunoensis]